MPAFGLFKTAVHRNDHCYKTADFNSEHSEHIHLLQSCIIIYITVNG